MKKIDVGFFRYSLLNRGGDRLIAEYASYLARSGHSVTMHVRVLDTFFSVDPRVTIQKIPYPGKAGTILYAASHNLGHDITIVDIIHLPLVMSLRNRVVYYAQADDREYYSSTVAKKMMEILYKYYFRTGSPVISMSQHLTDTFRSWFRGNTVYTIQSGIDHSMFYPDPDDTLLREKGANKAIVFLARGDGYRKGYDTALKTFAALDKNTTGRMELWVCGRPIEEDRFPFAVKNFGVISNERLRQILSSADIFFYPSRHEGFGLFPLEAMACGCVVVTTDAIPYAPTLASILTARIDNVKDLTLKISALIADETELNRRKDQSRKDSAKYDIATSKTEFESALLHVVKGSEACA